MLKKIFNKLIKIFSNNLFSKKAVGILTIVLFVAAMIPVNATEQQDEVKKVFEEKFLEPINDTTTADPVVKKIQKLNPKISAITVSTFFDTINKASSMTTGVLQDNVSIYEFYNDYLSNSSKKYYIIKINKYFTANEAVNNIPVLKSLIDNLDKQVLEFSKLSSRQQLDKIYYKFPQVESIQKNLENYAKNPAKLSYVINNTELNMDPVLNDMPVNSISDNVWKDYGDRLNFTIGEYARNIQNTGYFYDSLNITEDNVFIDVTKLLNSIVGLNDTLNKMAHTHQKMAYSSLTMESTGSFLFVLGAILVGTGTQQFKVKSRVPINRAAQAPQPNPNGGEVLETQILDEFESNLQETRFIQPQMRDISLVGKVDIRGYSTVQIDGPGTLIGDSGGESLQKVALELVKQGRFVEGNPDLIANKFILRSIRGGGRFTDKLVYFTARVSRFDTIIDGKIVRGLYRINFFGGISNPSLQPSIAFSNTKILEITNPFGKSTEIHMPIVRNPTKMLMDTADLDDDSIITFLADVDDNIVEYKTRKSYLHSDDYLENHNLNDETPVELLSVVEGNHSTIVDDFDSGDIPSWAHIVAGLGSGLVAGAVGAGIAKWASKFNALTQWVIAFIGGIFMVIGALLEAVGITVAVACNTVGHIIGDLHNNYSYLVDFYNKLLL